jgi:hypothetical protein
MILTESGIQQVRELAQPKKIRKGLTQLLVRGGRTEAAAKKFVQRRLARGETIEQVAREFIQDRGTGTADDT